MPTNIELKSLAETRLQEAKSLHNNGLYDGCYYIAGYSEELRYSPVHSFSKTDAKKVLSALEDVNDGVFVWLKKHW